MLPISPSAERPISSSGSTPSRPHSVAASSSPKSSRTWPSRSPLTRMTTPVTRSSAGPSGVDGVGERQRLRVRDGDVDRTGRASTTARCWRCPSRCWRARAGRRAGGRCSGAHGGSFLGQAATAAAGARRALAERVAVDDQGDLAVRQHGAAGGRGVLGHLGRQRAGDQLALADELVTATARRALAPCDDDAVVGRRGSHAASAAPPSTSGRTPSRSTSIRAPATERTRGRRAGPCARRGRAGPRTGASDLDEQRAAMIASVSGRRICAVGPARARTSAAPRRRARARWCGRRPCRRRGRRCRWSPRRWRSRGGRAARRRAPWRRSSRPRRRDEARARRPCGRPGRVDAAAVVAHGDDHVAAGVAGGDLERAGRRLAGGDALLRRLEAVVERVAHEVHERVAERVDDGAVELGLLADELELDLLAELRREVADEAREAQEDRPRPGSSGPA